MYFQVLKPGWLSIPPIPSIETEATTKTPLLHRVARVPFLKIKIYYVNYGYILKLRFYVHTFNAFTSCRLNSICVFFKVYPHRFLLVRTPLLH